MIETQKEALKEGHVTMEIGIVVMQLQTREYQGLPAATRS